MPYASVTELLEAKKKFEDAHGGNPVGDPDSHVEYFPDGASRRFSDAIGTFIEFVPQEPAQVLRAKRKYIELLLKLEQSAFTEFKNDCLSRSSYGGMSTMNVPPPPANAKELLEAGAKRIDKLRDDLAQLDRELDQLPESIARREYLDRQNQQAQARRQQGTEILSVNY